MIDLASISKTDRIVLLAVAVWTVACVGLVAVRVVRDPMDVRVAKLDDRLNSITYVDESFESPKELDDRKIREGILGKEALWKDLVPPPPPPAPVETTPNLDEVVKGIRPSAREQLSNAQGLKIKIRTEQNPAGAFYGVGDRVNGLTISEITPREVIFNAVVQKKEYTVSVKRL